MKKAKSKSICILLVAVILLNIVSWSTVTATGTQPTIQESAEPTLSVSPTSDYVEAGSIREIESRREENVKHFLLPDNTVQAVVYADAVHRRDADGNWQDLSNDLSIMEIKGVKFYTTADQRVVFAEKYAPSTQLWQLSENDYSIAMGMAQLQLSADATVTPVGGVTVTNAPQRRSATTWHSVEEARAVDNTASIVYSNVKTNTDLEYIMVGNDIKENIVVKSKSNSYTYQFNLTLTGLTAVLNEDGSISLTDSTTGQQQYSIPTPYMYDAAGEYSDAVTYTLKQTGEGAYTLSVTADSTWINAETRVFPVKIDPTVTRVDAIDTYINSQYPNNNYGSVTKLWIYDGTAALFKMSLPTLPATSRITSVTLNVSYYYYDSVTTGMIYAAAYQVLQPWNESTLTWNTASQNANQGISTELVTMDMLLGDAGAYQSSPGWAQFNITSIAESWYSGTPNYGVAIKYFYGTNSSVILNSYETGADHRPFFSITYSDDIPANGIYMLQNVGTNQYLDVRNGGCTAGTPVQQYYLAENSDVVNNQLFKFTWIGEVDGTHYFSVRPMTNSAMGLCAPLTGSVRGTTIEAMPLTDAFSDSILDREWIIAKSGWYYTIKNGDSTLGGYLATVYNDAGAQATTIDAVNDYSKWRLTKIEQVITGLSGSNYPQTLDRGDGHTYIAYVQSSIIGRNGPPIYSVVGTDGQATQKAAINRTTGKLIALQTGDVVINITYEGSQYIWSVPLTITSNITSTPDFHVDVVHYYDQGILARYTNAQNKITEYHEVCSEILREIFWLDISSDLRPYSSCLDACKGTVTSNSINEFCEAPYCPTPEYHRTGQAITDDAIENIGVGTPVLVHSVWTGHRLNSDQRSNSRANEFMILIYVDTAAHPDTGANYSETYVRQDRIFTLLHELSHQLGAKDHYCGGNDTNWYGNPCGNVYCYKCYYNLPEPECVMDRVYHDLEERLINGDLSGIYCAECMGVGVNGIPTHLVDHH